MPCLRPGRNLHRWSDTHVQSRDGHREEKKKGGGEEREEKKGGERGRNKRVLVLFVDCA